MKVLGIETSCDETSAAIVDDKNILSNIISTQLIHQEYGGVVPEFASRAHIRQLLPIIKTTLQKANTSFDEIDGFAVTYGPGLAGSLLVGLCICKGLALSLKRPWIGINHLEGHILASNAENPVQTFPYISLVASGGHTLLVHVRKELEYNIIGRTIDDAAGEAFDKVAKVLGLGYPGGPIIEKIARNGRDTAIDFPRALLEKNNLNFSFSGLKTAVLYYAQSLPKPVSDQQIADIAASFQKAVIDVLIKKSMRALSKFKSNRLVLAGGVARNNALRSAFEQTCKQNGIEMVVPSPELCTDNAAMIARAGHSRLSQGQYSNYDLDVVPNLGI